MIQCDFDPLNVLPIEHDSDFLNHLLTFVATKFICFELSNIGIF